MTKVTVCGTCSKHGYGPQTCPMPDKPKCGYCAGNHHWQHHECPVKSCNVKGTICTSHDIAKCPHCGGRHLTWSGKYCPVKQKELREEKAVITHEPEEEEPNFELNTSQPMDKDNETNNQLKTSNDDAEQAESDD
jgi:hypothetical protein